MGKFRVKRLLPKVVRRAIKRRRAKAATRPVAPVVRASPRKPLWQPAMKIFAISMIRNDGDLMPAILAQAESLFDHYMVVDVQSTDGTTEIIDQFAARWPHLSAYKFTSQEKHQGALMNALAREAFARGADWVFLIDGDEFLEVEGRRDLEARLAAFRHDVMQLPWINLVPSDYGSFDTFDVGQDFRWSGRIHALNKVAISRAYALQYPNFNIHEGNHQVSRELEPHGIDWTINLGIPLLHVPVRSADRLRYKISKALATLRSKHNSKQGEGFHVIRIAELLDNHLPGHSGLDTIAANYSSDNNRLDDLDVKDLGWPIKRLPAFCRPTQAGGLARTMRETAERDALLQWDPPSFAKGSVVQARVEGDCLVLAAQPISGGGTMMRERFGVLPPTSSAEPLPPLDPLRVFEAALHRPAIADRSWQSEMIPAIFGLFAALRPRRSVEVGIGGGATLFAACQGALIADSHTQVVAIDSWTSGDGNASLALFKQLLRDHFAWQYYIHADNAAAADRFEPHSVDILSLECSGGPAVLRAEFQRWLPKLTERGAIMVRGINGDCSDVWQELYQRYPSYAIHHGRGLGIAVIGAQATTAVQLVEWLRANGRFVAAVAALLGRSAIDQMTSSIEHAAPAIKAELLWRDEKIASLEQWHDGRRSEEADGLLSMWQSLYRMKRASSAPLDSDDFNAEYAAIAAVENLFDTAFYTKKYGDVGDVGGDPLQHYLLHGATSLYQPSSTFDPRAYLLHNRDVLLAGWDPLLHYALHGRNEGRVW